MRSRSALAMAIMGVAVTGTSHADFKYTQQSKMTGGALAGVTKSLGVFSKSAREANAPQLSTTMVRGNRMRTENSTGTVEIIDLDGRRFIHVDTAKKTYSIQTFDQFKQQMVQAQEKAKAEQTKSVAKHDDPKNVTMVPKIDVHETGETRTIMSLPAKQVKMRIDMLLQSTDPKTEADLEKSNSSFWMSADAWYGTIPGYEEVRSFYIKMSKELDWLPSSMGMANPQMSEAAKEMRINETKMDGMPLVEFTSFGMAGDAHPADGAAASAPQQPAPSSSDNSTPTNPKDAIAKQLGGLFGKKKKQQDDSSAKTTSNGVPQPASPPGSLMDVSSEVVSYSKEPLDSSLFDVPAGFTQVQPVASDAEKK